MSGENGQKGNIAIWIAVLALLGTCVQAYISWASGVDVTTLGGRNAIALEERRLKSELILKAIDAPDDSAARRRLEFFHKMRLIDLEDVALESVPAIPDIADRSPHVAAKVRQIRLELTPRNSDLTKLKYSQAKLQQELDRIVQFNAEKQITVLLEKGKPETFGQFILDADVSAVDGDKDHIQNVSVKRINGNEVMLTVKTKPGGDTPNMVILRLSVLYLTN